VGVLGDAAFAGSYASAEEARAAILVRMNNVDGIFSEQLAVEIQTSAITLYTVSDDPFTATTVPTDLLTRLRNVRRASASLQAYGVTHLFTGRNLDGDTVGIAYKGELCDAAYSASLTESTGRGAILESLIAAHEIGHNFGAPHDGADACVSTPANQYLMAARINGSSTFSQCSLDQMRPAVLTASCITALSAADVAVPATMATVRTARATDFALSIPVTNLGGMAATAVHAEITLPPSFTVSAASLENAVDGASCIGGAGVVRCDAGGIAGNTTATVEITAQASDGGSYSVSGTVSAANQSNVSNDATSFTVSVDGPADPAPPPPNTQSSGGGSGGGGGGGGAFGLLAWLPLGFLAAFRRRASRFT